MQAVTSVRFNEDEVYGRGRHLNRLVRPLRRLRSMAEKPLYARGWKSTTDLTLPDFLGIGAPQSGTTWLYVNLRAHPGLYLPDEKELHYFDRNFHRSLGAYARQFHSAGARLKGEVTPGYSILAKQQIDFISRVMPDVRLVYLIRNPIEQRLSMARRVLSLRHPDPFNSLPEQEVFRVLDERTGKPGQYALGLMKNSYAEAIRNWWACFPKERLLVGLFDDLRDRPLDLLRDIFAHIGADPNVESARFPASHPVNVNPKPHVPERFRQHLLDRYRPQIEDLQALIGHDLRRWLD